MTDGFAYPTRPQVYRLADDCSEAGWSACAWATVETWLSQLARWRLDLNIGAALAPPEGVTSRSCAAVL